MRYLKQKIVIVLIVIANTVQAQNTNWNIDSSHSSIRFNIDHLVSETTGEFNKYNATIKSDKSDFSDAVFEITIDASSIDTNDKKRDEHLRNPDFFDVEKYPSIKFKSTKLEKVLQNKYKLTGMFTMHGVTKEVTFDAKFLGIATDSRFGTIAGLKISGELKRYDFNLKYNAVMEAGGFILGKEVRIECILELLKG